MSDRKFKFFGVFPVIAVVAATTVAGCATAPKARQAAVPPQPVSRLDVSGDTAKAKAMTHAIAGEVALAHGDRAAANKDYAVAAAVSDDPEVAARSADLALAQGDRTGAGKAIGRMQATGADANALLRRNAEFALLKGHRDEARVDLAKLLLPGTRAAWRGVAQILASARDPALAGTVLAELATPETLPPKDVTIWIGMSQLGERLQRHQYAEQIADAAVKRFHDVTALAWAAHLKMQKGDNAAAKGLFQSALRQKPDDQRLRLGYAVVLDKLGDDKAAAAALAHGPQTLETYGARAAYNARAGDKAGLRRVYDALAKDAARIGDGANYLLGQLADSRGDAAAALGWYAKVPQDDEHFFNASARRAVLLAAQGKAQREKAHALVAQLIQLSEGDDDKLLRALLLDAQLYVRAGDTQAAIAAYDRGLSRLPKSGELFYGRALTYADAGKIDAAIADLHAVLLLDPDDVDAMNALGYTLADNHRDLPEAEKLLKRALAAKPDEPAVIDSWGWLQYRLGHLDRAEKSLRRAWKARPDPDIGIHLGEVLWRLGKHAEADKVFAAVRKVAPDSDVLRETLKRLKP